MSDKLEHGGTERCRGARHTTAKFSGQCCSCRFGAGALNSVENCVTKTHSCRACKAWQRYCRGEQMTITNVEPINSDWLAMEAAVRASMERAMQREMESLCSFDVRSTKVINTHASARSRYLMERAPSINAAAQNNNHHTARRLQMLTERRLQRLKGWQRNVVNSTKAEGYVARSVG